MAAALLPVVVVVAAAAVAAALLRPRFPVMTTVVVSAAVVAVVVLPIPASFMKSSQADVVDVDVVTPSVLPPPLVVEDDFGIPRPRRSMRYWIVSMVKIEVFVDVVVGTSLLLRLDDVVEEDVDTAQDNSRAKRIKSRRVPNPGAMIGSCCGICVERLLCRRRWRMRCCNIGMDGSTPSLRVVVVSLVLVSVVVAVVVAAITVVDGVVVVVVVVDVGITCRGGAMTSSSSLVWWTFGSMLLDMIVEDSMTASSSSSCGSSRSCRWYSFESSSSTTGIGRKRDVCFERTIPPPKS